MSLSHARAWRGLLASVGVIAATCAAAPAAHAYPDVNSLTSHTTDLEANGVTRVCSKVNVVVARGSGEQANISPGLDGWYWEGANRRSGPKSPFGTWNRIAKELFNPTDGSPATYTSGDDVLRTDLSYPATFDFTTSVPSGTVRLMNYLTSVSARCSQTKFVLLGFSQGGLVVNNAVSLPSRRIAWVSGTQSLTASVINRIVAVATVSDPGFNRDFNPAISVPGWTELLPMPSAHTGTMFAAGYAAGTIPDTGHAVNDGNFDPHFTGFTPRPINAYPVKTLTGAPADSVLDTALTENVVRKVRSYCIARDWACQNSNANNSLEVHNATDLHEASKKNLAIWAIDRIREKF